MRLSWYKQASPNLHEAFPTHIPSLCVLFSLRVSARELSGQWKSLFRHYLSRLVFPTTKLRMNESNLSVFDPRPENVLLFGLWWWRRWKESSFFCLTSKAMTGFFFFLFVCKLMPPCGCLQNRQIFLKWISSPVWDHLTVLCCSVSLQITNTVLYLWFFPGEIFWNTQFKDTIFGLFRKKCVFYLLDFLFYNVMLQGKNSVQKKSKQTLPPCKVSSEKLKKTCMLNDINMEHYFDSYPRCLKKIPCFFQIVFCNIWKNVSLKRRLSVCVRVCVSHVIRLVP